MYGEPPRCRDCGEIIAFARTKNGKLMPVDSWSLQVVPDTDGERFLSDDSGEMIRGHAVSIRGPKTVKAWRPHYSSCHARESAKERRAAENWNETQERIARELQEKKDAEAAETEARNARKKEKEKKEAQMRENLAAQLSIFGSGRV